MISSTLIVTIIIVIISILVISIIIIVIIISLVNSSCNKQGRRLGEDAELRRGAQRPEDGS